jgi:hypothetical protein
MKGWLTEVFSLVRNELGSDFSGYGINDVHGDFGQTSDFIENEKLQSLVLKKLSDTISLRDELACLLIEGSKLTVNDLINDLDPTSVLNILINVLKGARSTVKEGIAETLAEAGYLPLYGMPTRERVLYHGQVGLDRDRFKWQTMSRDSDLSIFEFAPGNELVKDKQRHLCIGFTGSLPDTKYPNIKVLTPLSEWQTEQFKTYQCKNCWAWFTVTIDEHQCPHCTNDIAIENIYECVTPLAYRTDMVPRGVDEQSDFKARTQLTYVETSVKRIKASNTNSMLSIHLAPQSKVVRINPNIIDKSDDGIPTLRGFKLERVKDNYPFTYLKGDHYQNKSWKSIGLTDQVIDYDIASSNAKRYESVTTPMSHDKYILGSRKITDCLILKLERPICGLRLDDLGRDPYQTSVRAAAISAMSLIVDRASLHLDIAPEEFEIMEPYSMSIGQGSAIPILQIVDTLANGGGFSNQLCSTHSSGKTLVEFLIHSMLDDRYSWPLVDFLSNDHQNICDQSCYSCLSRFGNRQYHGLLDWRLGLAYLRALIDPNYRCGLDGDWSKPELVDWQNWVIIYLEQFKSSQPDFKFEPVNSFGTFKIHIDSQPNNIFIIIHPLWDIRKNSLAKELKALIKEVSEGTKEVKFVSSFDLARRSFRSFLMQEKK